MALGEIYYVEEKLILVELPGVMENRRSHGVEPGFRNG
jgi:hypothetical protein